MWMCGCMDVRGERWTKWSFGSRGRKTLSMIIIIIIFLYSGIQIQYRVHIIYQHRTRAVCIYAYLGWGFLSNLSKNKKMVYVLCMCVWFALSREQKGRFSFSKIKKRGISLRGSTSLPILFRSKQLVARKEEFFSGAPSLSLSLTYSNVQRGWGECAYCSRTIEL